MEVSSAFCQCICRCQLLVRESPFGESAFEAVSRHNASVARR
jgi:hypothetical protein